MGGAAVEIKLQEIDKLARKLNEFVLSGGDKARLLNSLGLVIEEQTKGRFDTQRDPEGNEWRKITDAYRSYLEKHFPASSLLVREGFLRMSIERQLKGGDAVLVGSPREYAEYHQDAKSEKRRRRFLGFGTDDIAELQDAVDEFMKEKVA
jgi:phage virion morphogenesis protein